MSRLPVEGDGACPYAKRTAPAGAMLPERLLISSFALAGEEVARKPFTGRLPCKQDVDRLAN